MEKKYWKSIEEKNNQPVINPGKADEDASKSLLDLINEEIDSKPSSRRNFLKFCGFSFATAAIATSCKNPINSAIPFLNKPEEVTPGQANFYASTYFDGHDYNSILVKVRDGRPIKIEGNDLSTVSNGTTSARVQGSVLSLYDDGARFKTPILNNKESSWTAIDAEIITKLSEVVAAGKSIAIVAPTIISPSTLSVIDEFTKKYSTAKLVTYDSVSASGLIEANKISFGKAGIPDYKFDKADVIVSFGADFLGTWLMPVEYTRQFANGRRLSAEKKNMSELIVFEAGMSLTGANADIRVPVKMSLIGNILLNLANEIGSLTGFNGTIYQAAKSEIDIKALAKKLVEAKGKALVVCGLNNKSIQVVVNSINQMLQSYGNTIDFSTSLLIRKGNDTDFPNLVNEMNEGKVGAVIMYNSNPAYTYSNSKLFTDALKKIQTTVSFSHSSDETAKLCKYIAPDHHYLESWNDAEVKTGSFSLQQPCIRNIFDTRQAQDSLLKWAGSAISYIDFIKQYWQQNLIAKQTEFSSFNSFWNNSLQKGVFESKSSGTQPTFAPNGLAEAASAINSIKAFETEIIAYESVAIGDGTHSNNPWLMEMPDPISKITWDNYAAISVAMASKLGVETGDVLKIADGIELPAYVLPGQADGTISVALGFGRTKVGKVANGIGYNAFQLIKYNQGERTEVADAGKVSKTGKKYLLATTQMHHSMEGRDIVRETTLNEWLKKPNAGNEIHEEHEKKHLTLYKEYKFEGHHWGMAIDLNACTGCGACVIGCQAENNVPVVGKEEVARTRSMHWIRIDRYFTDNTANPSVYFQPIMCQHCDNAPCENVCPVSATNHSSEGLNQMAYNRCIGTKYCINNCPFKVRRFNWFRYATNDAFDYNMNSDLGRMVLNPDVTVRERGVVEKCTFCVQRIQESKLNAKLNNRPLADGEVVPACMQVCPAGAIVFGDMNDPESKISKMMKDERNYHVLEELHILPSVGYLTKVRNREEDKPQA